MGWVLDVKRETAPLRYDTPVASYLNRPKIFTDALAVLTCYFRQIQRPRNTFVK